jgi:hypothetical protein
MYLTLTKDNKLAEAVVPKRMLDGGSVVYPHTRACANMT